MVSLVEEAGGARKQVAIEGFHVYLRGVVFHYGLEGKEPHSESPQKNEELPGLICSFVER